MSFCNAKCSTAMQLGEAAARCTCKLTCQWGAREMLKVSAARATQIHSLTPPMTSTWLQHVRSLASRRWLNSQRVYVSPVATGDPLAADSGQGRGAEASQADLHFAGNLVET